MKAMGDHILSLNEMTKLMAEIANLVNERPIGIKPRVPIPVISLLTVSTWADAQIE